MKMVIDENVCIKHKMTLPEVLMALAVRHGIDGNEIHNMLNREILIEEQSSSWYLVTQHWSEVLDEILADSHGGERTDEKLEELANKMRELYPQGRVIDKKTGLPTPYFFRTGPKELARRLKTFFTRYGEYSDEEILDAERRYVASWRGNYQQRGFRILKYFIFKDDVKQGPDGNYVEPVSPLLDFLVNKEEEETVNVSDEWTSQMI